MENILYIEKMGCDFFYKDEIEKISDLGNYRFYTHNIELKNGKTCDTIEITNGARYQNVKGQLKSVDMFGLWLSTYYTDKNGTCKALLDIDKQINKKNYDLSIIYTKKDLLKAINEISKNKYTSIEIIEKY